MTHYSRILALVAVAAGCQSSPTESADPLVGISVNALSDTVQASKFVATDGVQYVELRTTLSVHNATHDSISRFTCSDVLQVLTNGEWRNLPPSDCFLSIPRGEVIAPGETKAIQVVSVLRPDDFETLYARPVFPGQYRYQLGLLPRNYVGPIPAAPSTAFFVVTISSE